MCRCLILSVFALAAQSVYAQCCPYVHPVRVEPANPTITDNVRLIFQATTPNQGGKISNNFTRSANSLAFDGCYYNGLATSPQTHTDTVRLGQLPAGNYTVLFTARQSDDYRQCVEVSRNTASLAFQVSGALSVRKPAEYLAVYPVPAGGRSLEVALPPALAAHTFRLLDATGRECYARPAAELPQQNGQTRLELPPLPAGTYVLKCQLADGGLLSQRVLLQ